jgi:hypothetical protein
MVSFTFSRARRLIKATAVAEGAAEPVVLPFESQPPVSFMRSAFGHRVLRPEVVDRVVGADLDRLAVPAFVMRRLL